MIPRSFYTDPVHFETEIQDIFQESWIFVGITSDLKNNNDFVCIEFSGVSIVVQNFSGALRAFQNICSHRYNPLQYDKSGNRPLICRYHFWRFDENGAPIGKAKSSHPDNACLKQYRVATCGKFVFVAMRNEAPELREFLSDFYDLLAQLSEHIGHEISSHDVIHAANWKLLVENVLECYHCASVHPETFIKGLGVGRMPLEDVVISNGHSACHFPRIPPKNESRRRLLLKHLERRALHHNSFYHVYIFPNLFISSTQGSSFYIGSALPMLANSTNLYSRFFEPQVMLTEPEKRKQHYINEQTTSLGLKVIAEDRAILERIQRTISIAEVERRLIDEEIRLTAFENTYMEKLEKPLPVGALDARQD